MVCIASFWLSTLISELFLSQEAVVLVKHSILQAMWIMIPAMAAVGGSGFALSRVRKGNLLAVKKKRMQLIAANGILILLPCAFTCTTRPLRAKLMRPLCAASGRASGGRHQLQPDDAEFS